MPGYIILTCCTGYSKVSTMECPLCEELYIQSTLCVSVHLPLSQAGLPSDNYSQLSVLEQVRNTAFSASVPLGLHIQDNGLQPASTSSKPHHLYDFFYYTSPSRNMMSMITEFQQYSLHRRKLVVSPKYSPLNSAHNPGSCCDSNPRPSEHSIIAEGQKRYQIRSYNCLCYSMKSLSCWERPAKLTLPTSSQPDLAASVTEGLAFGCDHLLSSPQPSRKDALLTSESSKAVIELQLKFTVCSSSHGRAQLRSPPHAEIISQEEERSHSLVNTSCYSKSR